MIVKTCRIVGDYTDAYIYANSLFAVTSEGEVHCYLLNSIFNNIVKQVDSESGMIAEYLFIRNDWLSATPLVKLLRISNVQHSFSQKVQAFPDRIEVKVKPTSTFKVPDVRGEVLDITMSMNTLFVGTDEVCNYAKLNIRNSDVELSEGDIFCDHQGIQLSVNTGLLSVSAAEDGVHSYDCTKSTIKEPMFEESDYSFRTSWLMGTLLNYQTLTSISAHSVQTKDAEKDRKKVVTSVNKAGVRINKNTFADKVDINKNKKDEDQIIYIFNSSSKFFAQNQSGQVVTGSPEKNNISRLQRTRVVDSNFSFEILSAKGFLGGGFIIECYDKVLWWSEGKRKDLFDGAALGVRSMPSSKRYKNLVIVTHEEGVDIICLINYVNWKEASGDDQRRASLQSINL